MMTSGNGDSSQAREKLAKMISGIRIAMLTTVADDGALHSRPMATQESDFDGDLWFFTAISAHKVSEIERDHHVNLSYADPDNNRYVSLSGMARLVRDPVKAKELWNPTYKAYFPKGLDDPDLGLLQVEVQSAEFWESPGGAAVRLAGFVKAVVSGERYSGGENRKLDL